MTTGLMQESNDYRDGYLIHFELKSGSYTKSLQQFITLDEAKEYADYHSDEFDDLDCYSIWGYSEKDRYYTRLLYTNKDCSRSVSS